jgi:hypothetical protein
MAGKEEEAVPDWDAVKKDMPSAHDVPPDLEGMNQKLKEANERSMALFILVQRAYRDLDMCNGVDGGTEEFDESRDEQQHMEALAAYRKEVIRRKNTAPAPLVPCCICRKRITAKYAKVYTASEQTRRQQYEKGRIYCSYRCYDQRGLRGGGGGGGDEGVERFFSFDGGQAGS